jgi:hypothetical protein
MEDKPMEDGYFYIFCPFGPSFMHMLFGTRGRTRGYSRSKVPGTAGGRKDCYLEEQLAIDYPRSALSDRHNRSRALLFNAVRIQRMFRPH